MSITAQLHALARKYDCAHEAVHPDEVVGDLTTILEGEPEEKPETPPEEPAALSAFTISPTVRERALADLRLEIERLYGPG